MLKLSKHIFSDPKHLLENRFFSCFQRTLTPCKRHNPAGGATQGYDRLHANRYGQVKERTQRTNTRTSKEKL